MLHLLQASAVHQVQHPTSVPPICLCPGDCGIVAAPVALPSHKLTKRGSGYPGSVCPQSPPTWVSRARSRNIFLAESCHRIKHRESERHQQRRDATVTRNQLKRSNCKPVLCTYRPSASKWSGKRSRQASCVTFFFLPFNTPSLCALNQTKMAPPKMIVQRSPTTRRTWCRATDIHVRFSQHLQHLL